MDTQTYKNPIIAGYNPDPSICRVGSDYYLVNSSFEYFPGVPVYHSTNLVNWELKGYCLTRKSQLMLEKCRPSGGIYAPTLRYHDGWFFMTTTNVTDKGNFIIHSRYPDRDWSDPVWVEQMGIDPSLLFDEDGKVYFTSTGVDEQGQACILICEVDPFTGEKLTKSRVLSYGCGGRCPEGPHLYKKDGWYYLMLAEGGTEYGHMETLQRGKSPYGPFEPCPHNPILTQSDDQRNQIHCAGHADLLEDENGNWWLVCLGIRPCSPNGYYVMLHNLGRETFLAPVVWNEDGWPVVGENGHICLEMEGPLPGQTASVNRDFADDFSTEEFLPDYNFLRNPVMENYQRCPEEKVLCLKGTDVTINEQDTPTWLGIRQKEFGTETTVRVKISSGKEGMRAGLSAYYCKDYHYEIYLTKEKEQYTVCLAKHLHDLFAVTAKREVALAEGQEILLKIRSDREKYAFFFSVDGEEEQKLGEGLTAGLCTEGTYYMTFTGTYLAMFAEQCEAKFREFRCAVTDEA